MKLAEALNARKELEARLTRLEERLHASARVQEGLEPDESPDALYAMLEKAAAELVEIVSRISRTNVETVVGPPPRPPPARAAPARAGR